MRGEEKRSWWEHGRAGAHFPWETAVPRTSSGRPAGGGLPCGHIPGRSGEPPGRGAAWERASSPARSRATQVHHPPSGQTSVPSSQRGKCLPLGKLRHGPWRCPRPGAGQGRAAGHRTGQPSSSGHCRARTALRRRAAAGRKRGRRCREGDRETVTHCGWAGLAGVASARRPAHPSTCRAADRLEPRLLPRSPCQE